MSRRNCVSAAAICRYAAPDVFQKVCKHLHSFGWFGDECTLDMVVKEVRILWRIQKPYCNASFTASRQILIILRPAKYIHASDENLFRLSNTTSAM